MDEFGRGRDHEIFTKIISPFVISGAVSRT